MTLASKLRPSLHLVLSFFKSDDGFNLFLLKVTCINFLVLRHLCHSYIDIRGQRHVGWLDRRQGKMILVGFRFLVLV